MESDFGINTPPDCIDGWVAGLMRSHSSVPVLRLWLSSQVSAACGSVADHLGDTVARRQNILNEAEAGAGYRSGASGIVPLEASVLGVSEDEVAKYNTAWEILQTSTNSVDYGTLCKYLEYIGVYDALDLRQCDEEDIAEITKLLKKIQRKVFTTCCVPRQDL